MFIRIGEVLPQLHVYEALFPQHERLLLALSAIYCDLIVFCYEAKKVLRKPKRSMFSTAWRSFERQFGELIQRFTKHQSQVEREVQTSHMIESAESRSLVRCDQVQLARERKSQFPSSFLLSPS